MTKRLFLLAVVLLLMSAILLSCSKPQHSWPQSDVQVSELNDPSLEKKILIASLTSEFKNAVVGKIRETFRDESVYMKFAGIEQLKEENGSDYSAVVVIVDTCINWKIERHVKDLLRRHKDQSSVVILAVFDDNYGGPKTRRYNLDAISAASEMHKVDEVAGKIIDKIRVRVGK